MIVIAQFNIGKYFYTPIVFCVLFFCYNFCGYFLSMIEWVLFQFITFWHVFHKFISKMLFITGPEPGCRKEMVKFPLEGIWIEFVAFE